MMERKRTSITDVLMDRDSHPEGTRLLLTDNHALFETVHFYEASVLEWCPFGVYVKLSYPGDIPDKWVDPTHYDPIVKQILAPMSKAVEYSPSTYLPKGYVLSGKGVDLSKVIRTPHISFTDLICGVAGTLEETIVSDIPERGNIDPIAIDDRGVVSREMVEESDTKDLPESVEYPVREPISKKTPSMKEHLEECSKSIVYDLRDKIRYLRNKSDADKTREVIDFLEKYY